MLFVSLNFINYYVGVRYWIYTFYCMFTCMLLTTWRVSAVIHISLSSAFLIRIIHYPGMFFFFLTWLERLVSKGSLYLTWVWQCDICQLSDWSLTDGTPEPLTQYCVTSGAQDNLFSPKAVSEVYLSSIPRSDHQMFNESCTWTNPNAVPYLWNMQHLSFIIVCF